MIKRIIIITCLFYALSANATPYVSLQYGVSSFTDEKKNTYDFTLRGNPIKIVFGQRYAHLEFEIFAKLLNSTGSFKHDEIQNKIEQSSKTFGGGIGIYIFPALRLNLGLSINSIKESLETSVSEVQRSDIINKFGLSDSLLFGPYFGAEYNVLTFGKIKTNIALTYYNFSEVGGKEVEITFGIKIPFGGDRTRSPKFDPMKVFY